MDYNYKSIATPYYVVDENLLIKNLEKLAYVQKMADCKILLAQKAFSMFYFYKLIGKYLKGTAASSLHEARLGSEEMGGEVHIFSPSYKQEEMDRILSICSHMVFNSFAQWKKFKQAVINHGEISAGLRINPEYSEVATEIYDPCAKGSRLGITYQNFINNDFEGIEGLHFHTMCEQNSDTLKRTLEVVQKKFGAYLYKIKWLNMGGGHHITREDYDTDTLIECIKHIKNKYNVEVYLEPGEAIALNTGFLVSEVVDIIYNEKQICIMDASVACHMPDVQEMPYRPNIINADFPNKKSYTYRLTGPTCLAGDIIGDYSFDRELKVGDRIVLTDMAHYTMVKNNTFNGINLPSIVVADNTKVPKLIKKFGYEDFKKRLS